MSGINCQLIVCILQEQNRQLSGNGRIHLDSCMWTLDLSKWLSCPQPSELLLGWQSC